MADGFVQVTDAFGNKAMEMSTLTRSDSTVVYRERVTVGDPVNIGGLAQVGPRGMQVDNQMLDMMREVLIELRVMNAILAQGLNVTDNLDLMRGDPTLITQLQQ